MYGIEYMEHLQNVIRYQVSKEFFFFNCHVGLYFVTKMKCNFLAVMCVSVTKSLAIKWSASDECKFCIPYYKYAVCPRFALFIFFCKMDIRQASTSFHAAKKESTQERAELRWKESGCLNNLVKQSCPTGLNQADCYVRQKYTSI